MLLKMCNVLKMYILHQYSKDTFTEIPIQIHDNLKESFHVTL